MFLLSRRSVISLSTIARGGASRAMLVLAACVLTAGTASAKSAGCTAVPTDFPSPGVALAGGASTTINTFAVGEVITFTESAGAMNVTVTQGDGATIATLPGPGVYLTTPITSSGTASVTVKNNSASAVTLSAVCNAPSSYTVTVSSDPATGTASNCTAGSTTDASCSLRDAVAAVNTLSGATGTIFFSPSVVGSIVLTHGVLEFTHFAVANLTGPGANFLALSGNNASGILQADVATTVTISGLAFTAANGDAITTAGSNGLAITACAFSANNGGVGSAVFDGGSAPLTITSSSFYGNVSGGGAVFMGNGGTMTVNNSTFTGNTSSAASGAIFALSSNVSMTNTTITANQAFNGGGVLLNGGTLTLANTVIAGNSATSTNADLNPVGATLTDNGGNYFSTNDSVTSTLAPNLLPLGNYGGPIETMLPAPLSPLLCQGTAANATSAGLTLDERNDPRTTVYGSTTCVDTGAAQSNYSLSFVQQPTTTIIGLAITPSPTVQWKESGIAFDVAGQPIPMAATAGTLSGTTPQNTNASGIATFSGLSIGSAQTGDTLKSTLPLSTSPAISVSATSNAFNVIAPVTAFSITALPSTATAGTAVGFTVTALNGSSTSTQYTGTITISSAQDPLLAFVGGSVMYTFTAGDAGVHTFTVANGAVFKTAGSDTLTVTDTFYNVAATSSAITVTAATPALLSAVSGSGQTVHIGGTFTAPLKVKVTDIYGNPNSGVTVTYTGPASGAGLAPASSNVSTVTDGTASLAAIANATASATAYTVAASVVGIATPVDFTLTNTQAASSISVAQVAPLPANAGTGINVPTTFVATLSDATQNSAGLPTGTVQFFSGSTPLGSPVTIVNAQASLTTTFTSGGSFNITAQYAGDNNFTGSSSNTLVEVVAAAGYTISLSPTSLTITGGGNATTTVTITPSGNYQGTLTLNCSGLVEFSSCAFAPTSVALNGSNTPQQVTLTVYTLGPSNTSSLRRGPGTTLDAGLLWLPGIALAALLALHRRKLAKHLSRIPGILAMLLLAGAIFGLAGCAPTHYWTPTGTDLISVNSVGVAAPGSGSANLNQTATLTLIVQ